MENNSEKLFAKYLEENNYSFEKEYIIDSRIDNKNVDFKILSTTNNRIIFADVKEVRNSPKRKNGNITANTQIKKDIKKLRQKFSNKKISQPVVLVTMNFSDSFFTGLTVVQAIYGNLEVTFDKNTFTQLSEIHHSKKGNAEFTKTKNTLVSGILVFKSGDGLNYFFENYFAKNKIDIDFFHNTKYFKTDPYLKGKAIIEFSSIMI